MSRRNIEAWMDGVALSELGPIWIQDVNEPAPEMEITYMNRPVGAGQIIQRRKRKNLRITIKAQIQELWDLDRRTELREAIAEWCEGSILELSNHPDRRLHVCCKASPGMGDDRDFNSVIQIELEANEIPYWEDAETVKGKSIGSGGEARITITGTAKDIPIMATFTPDSGNTCTSLTLSTGERTITISGISTQSAIIFSRDEADRLEIKSGDVSLLRYRTKESDDDLKADAGVATITWSANCSGRLDVSARGRWL